MRDPGAAEPSDEGLLAAVAGGDPDALARLYDRHAPWLFLRLRRRCGDEGQIGEVVQDSFLAVWRAAGRYRSGSVGGWIWTIAARRLVDAYRARAARPEDPAPDAGEVAGVVSSTEDDVLGEIEHGALAPALAGLSPELRAVLQATVIDGLGAREAAQMLGVPEGTVKTRARRARLQLREALA
jgi:RNA polymerase sigma-70 factor (ECF subfamily)